MTIEGQLAAWLPSEDPNQSGNVLHDASGNDHHGTINGATWDVGEDVGLIYDGNDFTDFGPSVDLGVLSWTISIRFKASSLLSTSTAGGRLIHNRGTGSGGTTAGAQICVRRLGSSVAVANCIIDDASKSTSPFSNIIVGDIGQWVDILWVYDRSQSVTQLFAGSAKLNSRSVQSNMGSLTTLRPWLIGTSGFNSQWLHATVGDIRIFNEALTPNEVAKRTGQIRPARLINGGLVR